MIAITDEEARAWIDALRWTANAATLAGGGPEGSTARTSVWQLSHRIQNALSRQEASA